ncbi:MAG: hypothetical protein BJBARM5_0639 [Candidatus Parvarchaeum acidophilus ARMAN-5]|jgi:hypothetical protein|uniref:Uncharacterized protein n=1 Tax=Candidatus Parvarchaeum acidophilus ARMAN-5 TaxID=662762 RepID=D6GVX0_PARA5|nr:MAG: hypothetical protein BJBARM5_0639 [Candidatus Parvarchaeum acidophilus ARMAN-5]
MGLFDLIGYAAEKSYKKYKDSKLEGVMDDLLVSLETNSINLEVLPYKEGEDPCNITGKVYKLDKSQIDNSAATYFLTTNRWLKKGGVDIDNDNVYLSAFNEKSYYALSKIKNEHPAITQNYVKLYNNNKVLLALFVYLSEDNKGLCIPKYITDKKGQLMLSKKASIENFNKVDELSANDKVNGGTAFKGFYLRAKLFAYKVANELNSYNKDDLESALKQFEEKHGKNTEITYTF